MNLNLAKSTFICKLPQSVKENYIVSIKCKRESGTQSPMAMPNHSNIIADVAIIYISILEKIKLLEDIAQELIEEHQSKGHDTEIGTDTCVDRINGLHDTSTLLQQLADEKAKQLKLPYKMGVEQFCKWLKFTHGLIINPDNPLNLFTSYREEDVAEVKQVIQTLRKK